MESDSFIFDDDVEEIGSDVEAFCPKCKADTAHTILTKYEDEIRRVQCSPCGDLHAYRKPRGEVEEAEAEEKASKKKAQKKLGWDEFFAKHDPNLARPYSFRDTYIENDIVTHPKFGLGFASETFDEDKVEITFKDSRRVLVHNRKELPGAPPELARAPKPRPTPKDLKSQKKGKAGKGGAAAAAGPAGPSPRELAKQKAAEAKAAAAAKKAAEKEKARLKKEKEHQAKLAAKQKAAEKKAAAKARAEAKKAAAKAKKAAAKAKAEAKKAKAQKVQVRAKAARPKAAARKARPAAKAKKKK